MEHMREDGLSQGYFCYTCGGVTNMYGTGHQDCKPDRSLVKKLIELNKIKKDSRLAAAYVYHSGIWPAELVSGVMFFDGIRITKKEFVESSIKLI